MSRKYDFQAIERRWQSRWAERQTFRTPDPGEPGFDPARPKFYVLDMFPYPSGAGLHVGHPLGYIATDIVARYKRMRGFNVLHPMGFDAFGLPAEQYAVEHGVHPRETTERNIANMRRQLQAFGLSYDWSRELATTDVDYYRWTQWIFLQLYQSYFDPRTDKAEPVAELRRALERGELKVDHELQPVEPGDRAEGLRAWSELDEREKRAALDSRRLAYLAEIDVNWCPALGTVLANEEVTAEGRSERGNHPVFKRPLEQWMLRITAYAERLLDDLQLVDWPEPIKLMQRNWIGRSEGALADFRVVGTDDTIRIFTTRPDTLFGATYMVLAPEHPLVDRVTTDAQRGEVAAYREQAQAKTEIDRQAEGRKKTGVFTGGHAINPVDGERIPIWIADYVLMGYGTGAIMAVPAHDERDFAFATQFSLPVKPVLVPDDVWLREQAAQADPPVSGDVDATRAAYLEDPKRFAAAFCGDSRAIHSRNDEIALDELPTAEAKRKITAWLAEKGLGRFEVQYKLRDWLFSRQRYWGEPFPILHGPDGSIRSVPDEQLPVTLPPMDDFSPTASDDPSVPPQPALARAPHQWREMELDGVRYRRELNTMPQWAGSCWYYLRFIDPKNDRAAVAQDKERYWMGERGVDLYVGGAEHAVLHLLYARFWHKLLYDLGHVSTPEPFGRLFNQGYILAAAYTDARGVYVPAAEVEQRDDRYLYRGEPVRREYGKMGKSLKNAVDPDELFGEYGCDTLRLYEMYMGPIETSKPWNTRDIVGVHRFLQRVWRNFFGDPSGRDDAQDGNDDADAILVSDEQPEESLARALHKTIKRVTDDMERLRFNTAIAALIELNNTLVGLERLPRAVAEPFVLMLAPFAPHVAEELWQALGHEQSLAREPWPGYDEAMLVEDRIEIAVQVKGKTRGRVEVAAGSSEQEVTEAALADPRIAKHVGDKPLRKVIYVPGRLVNLVV